jgi:hypothetical protein
MIVNFRGEELDVEYDLIGDYRMATYDHPAENPDIIITSINYKGVDIMPILSEEEIDLIYEQVFENYD